jgi:hypothetical protein
MDIQRFAIALALLVVLLAAKICETTPYDPNAPATCPYGTTEVVDENGVKSCVGTQVYP